MMYKRKYRAFTPVDREALALLIRMVSMALLFLAAGIYSFDSCLAEDAASLRGRLEPFRLNPLPASLEKARHVHPRIFIDSQRIAELKKSIATTHKALWEETKQQADKAVHDGPPVYKGNGDGEGRWGFEQLWQRNVGNFMSTLAMAWVLTGDRRYLDSARDWALASCGYKTWGGLGYADGIDLAASHQLFGLGIVYDWCYNDLDENAKKIIRETLIRRSAVMAGQVVREDVWWNRSDYRQRIWYHWKNSYLQNHLWVNMCGLTVAGLSIYDEADEAALWIGLAQDKINRTLAVLGVDGASHEGVAYWDYGVENLLKFMTISHELLDRDMFDNEWFRNTANYRIYLSLPLNSWTSYSNVIDIGDCSRGSWYSDYNLRALAGEYSDGHAQWLARRIDEAQNDSPRLRWLNLIWYDPAVAETELVDLPTLRHFTDIGIVSARSDWSGDESLVVFKCGPYIGHHALKALPYDASSAQHVHPDANHFILYGGGECLIRDDGYHAKWTDQHNTLLVDGRGQTGEGSLWFDGADVHVRAQQPRIIMATSTPEFDHFAGEAAAAYPPESGLTQYTRHILYIKPDITVIADIIKTDTPRDLEIRFHPENKDTVRDGESFIFQGRKAKVRLDPLTPQGVLASTEDMTADNDSGELDPLFTVRLRTKGREWRNAVGLSWSSSDGEPSTIRMREEGDIWTFITARGTITLNTADGCAEYKR